MPAEDAFFPVQMTAKLFIKFINIIYRVFIQSSFGEFDGSSISSSQFKSLYL